MSNPYLKMSSSSRREFVLNCAKTTLGVSVLSHADRLMAASQELPKGLGGKAKAVIYLYMAGGMSHIDTFDPKTGATKGFADPIKTNADFQLGGYMTKTAQQADKISVVRSMITKTGVHQSANYMMHTGYEPRSTIIHPSLGAWAHHFLGKKGTLPASVNVMPDRRSHSSNNRLPSTIIAISGPRGSAGATSTRSIRSCSWGTTKLS